MMLLVTDYGFGFLLKLTTIVYVYFVLIFTNSLRSPIQLNRVSVHTKLKEAYWHTP